MDYKVILSDLFLCDLQEIVDYLKEHAGPEIASRIGNELLDRALEAGQRPFLGQSVKRRPGARKVLRYPYLIYYDVNETRKTVEVLRIWHGARDPKTLRLDG
ncbi:MAG: type II toxin-antitoxin system RelE/ParE family toxin [Terrimicrobiaceae bacterium]|nr:type II toxin-antitoxin system RelE/ParE family toxin [Terrimicrobiaceae bacterium]